LAFVLLGAHSGLKSDIARGPKSAQWATLNSRFEMKETVN